MKELLEMLALPPANLPLLAVAGMIVRRWHRRLIVGLEVVVQAAPGQAPTGPAIKSDDLF